MNKIKILIIKFIGLGAVSCKIYEYKLTVLIKLGTYHSGRIKKEIQDKGI